jgi:hypothetical protein
MLVGAIVVTRWCGMENHQRMDHSVGSQATILGPRGIRLCYLWIDMVSFEG